MEPFTNSDVNQYYTTPALFDMKFMVSPTIYVNEEGICTKKTVILEIILYHIMKLNFPIVIDYVCKHFRNK